LIRATRRPQQRCCRSFYAELRKLAAARLAQEKPGQTLEATALVHEATCDFSAAERTILIPEH
jgi:hypothetical protein